METRISNEAFVLLMQRYIENRHSDQDFDTLVALIDDPYFQLLANDLIEGRMQQQKKEAYALDEVTKERLNQLLTGIISQEEAQRPTTISIFKRYRYVAAAAIIILMAGASWFLLHTEKIKPSLAFTGKVAPGKEGAKLRLSNGAVIMIDSLQDGLIAMDGKIAVYKQNGQILYKGASTDAVVYNEIITDRGRQWSAQLPDGSTVWLNAASSLRYPLTFSGSERMVTMTGEASFKVVHNDAQPFKVSVRDHIIEDIGTEFNINAYNNEPKIVTTVVEGVASVTVSKDRVVVEAGKEARIKEGKLVVSAADTDHAIAWRKGYFDFEGADLKTLCRQLERWYDIDVVFEADVPDVSFGGSTKRSKELGDVLDVLRLSGVRFRLEEASNGKQAKLVLMP